MLTPCERHVTWKLDRVVPDLAGSEGLEGMKASTSSLKWIPSSYPVRPGAFVWASGRLLNLGYAAGHPSFEMSCSSGTRYWRSLISYLLPMGFYEKVARFHLAALGSALTVFCPGTGR